MQSTLVENAEDLYRAIRADCGGFALTTDGRVKFSASAFNDKARQPSVDRSSIRTDPCATRINDTDGVTVLNTGAVRSIETLRVNPANKNDDRTYQVDAIHRPLPNDEDSAENPAHCQIECCPSIASDNHFKKLKEALALLASRRGFVVNPTQAN